METAAQAKHLSHRLQTDLNQWPGGKTTSYRLPLCLTKTYFTASRAVTIQPTSTAPQSTAPCTRANVLASPGGFTLKYTANLRTGITEVNILHLKWASRHLTYMQHWYRGAKMLLSSRAGFPKLKSKVKTRWISWTPKLFSKSTYS